MEINLTNIINAHLSKHKQDMERYPNQYKEIHKVSCLNCPSVVNDKLNIIDPEMEDIKSYSRGDQIKSVFLCGWRGSKLCKGYCDVLNISQNDLPK
jgi:hypothetical protein